MIKLERILCPTDLSEDSERTLRYAVALARASGAKLFVCHRARSEAEQEEALHKMQTLIAAGQAFPTGVTEEVSTLEWENVLLDGSDLGTLITREAELRHADLIFMRSRRRQHGSWVDGGVGDVVADNTMIETKTQRYRPTSPTS